MIWTKLPRFLRRKRIKEFQLLTQVIPWGRDVICHSGHRELVNADLPDIEKALEEKLREITRGDFNRFILVSGIAVGADELTATKAAEMGLKVHLLMLPDEGDEARVEALVAKFGKTMVSGQSIVPYLIGASPDEQTLVGKQATENKTVAKAYIPSSYKTLAGMLVNLADHLIVLWDGVDTGKEGGTSDVVNMALQARQGRLSPPGRIYQLIIPRQVNPQPLCGAMFQRLRYLPPPGTLEWAEADFPQAMHNDRVPWLKRNIYYSENFWRFFLPVFWVLATVIIGTWGFRKEGSFNWVEDRNAFFNAVNLLTFNTSTEQGNGENIPLNIARFAGLLFVLNAFIVAFMLAIGSNNKNLLRLLVWRVIRRKRKISLITGLNATSYMLGMILKQEKQRVIIIDKAPDANLKTEAAKRGIRVMHGSPQSTAFLKRISAVRAQTVFLLEDADADNIRSLQEMDQLWASHPEQKRLCHIHVKEARAAEFVGELGTLFKHVTVRRLNFHETISRKLLMRYPVYRNIQVVHKPLEILLFGFGEMGQQLLLTLLHSIQLNSGQHVNITIFAEDASAAQDKWYRQYPCLWYDDAKNPHYKQKCTDAIRKEIFPEGKIRFKELPLSDACYYNDESILRALDGNHSVTAYFCLDDALQGAAYLSGFLGKIAKRLFDMQIFCYCNLADESEFDYISHILNKQLPETPIILFGQIVDECRALAKGNATIDDLPALINLWYSGKQQPEQWKEKPEEIMRKARDDWKTLPYSHKESNRRAADHLWIKLRHTPYSLLKIQKELSDIQRAEALYAYFSKKENTAQHPLFERLSETEQHRWCAEKLLNGFLPLQDYDISGEDVDTRIARWNSDRAYKALYQSQKLHIDLVPYKELSDVEKAKDRSQINGIPYFIHVLTQCNTE